MPPSAYTAPTVSLPAAAIAEASALNPGNRALAGGPGLGAVPGSANAGVPKRAGLSDSVGSIPPGGGRPLARTESVFSAGPFEDSALLRMPNNRRRNVVIGVVLIVLAGGGGAAAYLYQQKAPAPSARVVFPPAGGTSGENAPARAAADPVRGAAEAEVKNAAAPARPAAPPPTSGTAAKPEAASPPASPSPAPGRGGKVALAGPLRGSTAAAHGEAPSRSGGSIAAYEKMVSEADRLLERGQTTKAEKLYTQALGAKPDGAAALTGIAYVLLDRQRHFKAIETFRRVLDSQPAYGPALFGIAESYRARGDTAQALVAYRQYLSVSPSGADAPAARRQIKELESAKAGSASAARKTDDDDDEDD